MTIAPTLKSYLDRNVTYDLVTHDPTLSSLRTAQATHIPGGSLAKGIVLRAGDGYVLAVLPASRRVQLSELKTLIGDDVELADEQDVAELFQDCAVGAVPPVGKCYGLEVIVDESIEAQPEVYLEGGDHQTLVHMNRAQFARLMADARHARFSAQA
ncbi:MAG: YbaK/EbsC family protein [Rhodospirillales bacterium]|nr:YbaK/EbsC family protein [Rhodospirillales bacterium]